MLTLFQACRDWFKAHLARAQGHAVHSHQTSGEVREENMPIILSEQNGGSWRKWAQLAAVGRV